MSLIINPSQLDLSKLIYPASVKTDADRAEYVAQMQKDMAAPSDYMPEHVNNLYSDKPIPGYLSPWRGLDSIDSFGRKQFRFRSGEITLLVGINGHGKSLVVGDCVVGITAQGGRTMIASMEMPGADTTERLASEIIGCDVANGRHLMEAANYWMDGKISIYTKRGRAKLTEILDRAKFYADNFGLDTLVIDSMMMFGISQEDLRGQDNFVEELKNFTTTNPVHVFIIVHPKKSENENYRVGKMDIKGSGGITDLSDNVLAIQRNRKKEDKIYELERKRKRGCVESIAADMVALDSEPDATLYVDKHRKFGTCPTVPLWFDNGSLQFHDTQHFKTRHFTSVSLPEIVVKPPTAAQAMQLHDVKDDGQHDFPF